MDHVLHNNKGVLILMLNLNNVKKTKLHLTVFVAYVNEWFMNHSILLYYYALENHGMLLKFLCRLKVLLLQFSIDLEHFYDPFLLFFIHHFRSKVPFWHAITTAKAATHFKLSFLL